MKIKTVPFSWILKWGLRLDTSPYMGGAVEARVILEKVSYKKEPLRNLTKGHNGGIYNGPMFRRNYVDSAEHGIPFLTGGSMLKADLSDLPFLRRKDAESSKLSFLRLTAGTTMISCSGTIGRMVYTRSDMEKMWSSQDVLKVVPNESRVSSGYLHAFLTSKFGVPLITSGTYGAIIQHIEAEHIADLPVPRLGEKVERKAHELVEKAAVLRIEASRALQHALLMVEHNLGASVHPRKDSVYQVVHKLEIQQSMRLEAFFYNPRAARVTKWAVAHPNGHWQLSDIARVYDVPPFKHIYIEAANGVPFFTSGELFKLDRKPENFLSKTQTKGLEKYILGRGWVLLARSGQLGGIIGHPQFSDSTLDGAATSDHVIRIIPKDAGVPSGYLYAYLATSTVGYPLITKTISGSSVPALWPIYLESLPIVKAPKPLMFEVDRIVRQAFEMRVEATSNDDAARALVEKTIEEAA